MLNHKTILDAFGPAGWRMAHRLRTVYWWVRRPVTLGAMALIENDDGQVLLIRQSYVPGWRCVAGGVEKGETLEETLRREVGEEVGLTVTEIQLLNVHYRLTHGTTQHVGLYRVRVDGHIRVDGTEILEAKWFNKEQLPSDLGPVTHFALMGETSPQRWE